MSSTSYSFFFSVFWSDLDPAHSASNGFVIAIFTSTSLTEYGFLPIKQTVRIKGMYHHIDKLSNLPSPLIADDVYEIIMKVFLLDSPSGSSFPVLFPLN